MSKTKQIAKPKSKEDLANELAVEKLLPEINANHRECMKCGNDAVDHAIAAGKLLCEMRESVKHGDWEPLIESRCDFSDTTARAYMTLSTQLPAVIKALGKNAPVELTIRGGLKLIGESKPKKSKPRQMSSALPNSPPAAESNGKHTKTEPPQPAKPSEGPLNDEPEEELTFDEHVKEANGKIESFCRQLTKFFEDNCPKLDSIDYQGRFDSALAQVRAACGTLRTCKYHDQPCPKCSGEGCSSCAKESDFGAVTVLTYRQLAG